MKRLIGVILVIGALALGYLGYTKLDNSKAELKIGDLELSAKDKDSQSTAYIYLGLGAACLIAGLLSVRGKS